MRYTRHPGTVRKTSSPVRPTDSRSTTRSAPAAYSCLAPDCLKGSSCSRPTMPSSRCCASAVDYCTTKSICTATHTVGVTRLPLFSGLPLNGSSRWMPRWGTISGVCETPRYSRFPRSSGCRHGANSASITWLQGDPTGVFHGSEPGAFRLLYSCTVSLVNCILIRRHCWRKSLSGSKKMALMPGSTWRPKTC